jgi:quinol monooxygenase YgiN
MLRTVSLFAMLTVVALPSAAPDRPGPDPAQAAAPAGQGAVHVVSYVEAVPGAERMAIAILRRYRDESRREQGSLRVDILQQIGRPGHLIVLEAWQDGAALSAHEAAAHTKQLAAELPARLASPIDRRLFNTLAIAVGSAGEDSIYVVTHVDTIPTPGSNAEGLLKQLADDSRKDEGNQRFDVVQSDRRNHFTVIEAWRTQRALDAHTGAAHTKEYRDSLQPLAGSPLDERVLTVVK